MGGHLDALKYLRTELRCEWEPSAVVYFTAQNGHVHVLQWAIENGVSLALLASSRSDFLTDVCENGHLAALEWLLAAHLPMLERVFFGHAPANARMLEVLSSRVGTATVIEALQSLLDDKDKFLAMSLYDKRFFAPSVVEWCMQQGMRFDEDFFHRMMQYVAHEGAV